MTYDEMSEVVANYMAGNATTDDVVEALKSAAPEVQTKASRWSRPMDEVMADALEASKLFGELEPIVNRFLYRKNITMLAANNNVGKTMASIYAGVQISQCPEGTSIFDHAYMPLKQQGKVLLCVGEGGSGLQNRIEAAVKELDCDWQRERFQIMRGVPMFKEADPKKNMVDDWRIWLDLMQTKVEKSGFRPDVLIIDHLSRASIGVNENSADEMTPILANIRTVAEKLECAVLLLHHTNKGEGEARGSTAIAAEVDAAFLMEVQQVDADVREACAENDPRIDDETNFIKLTCTKMRDDTFPAPMDGVIVPVDLGTNGSGEQVTGGVLSWYYGGFLRKKKSDLQMEELVEWWDDNQAYVGTLTDMHENHRPISGRKSDLKYLLEKLVDKGFLETEPAGRGTAYKLCTKHAI